MTKYKGTLWASADSRLQLTSSQINNVWRCNLFYFLLCDRKAQCFLLVCLRAFCQSLFSYILAWMDIKWVLEALSCLNFSLAILLHKHTHYTQYIHTLYQLWLLISSSVHNFVAIFIHLKNNQTKWTWGSVCWIFSPSRFRPTKNYNHFVTLWI